MKLYKIFKKREFKSGGLNTAPKSSAHARWPDQ